MHQKLTNAEKHELQHRRIAEAEDAYDAAPNRTGADKLHRRELGKKAWWTLTGHMRAMHDVRGQAPFLRKSYEDVVRWHDRLHVEESVVARER